MGIEFRWQVGVDEKWEVAESSTERRWRFPWRAVGILALLLTLGAGIAAGLLWQRIRQREERLRRELRIVSNLEMQALREGDMGTFLSLQDRDDTRWYNRQKGRVPSWTGYHIDAEPGQDTNLGVLAAAFMPEGRAWAEVAWAQQDGIFRRVQFYRQEDDRWLRTGVRDEYFGQERTHQTRHFTFHYLARDEPTVDWMAEQLEAWYDAICTDLGCGSSSRIRVRIALDGVTDQEYHPPQGFIVHSTRLDGVRDDGAPLPEGRQELARVLFYLVAVRWRQIAAYPQVVPQTGSLQPWEQPYLLPQFVNWQQRRLGLAGEETPPTPVFDAVMGSRGIEGVRALLATMAGTASENEALYLALGTGLEDLDLVFDQYLAALLAVERQMMEWQAAELVSPTSARLARQIFGALLAEKAGSWRSQKDTAFQEWPDRRGVYLSGMPLSYPAVDRWGLLDDSTLWAEVTYSHPAGLLAYGATSHRVEFFQRVDGAWRHAPPDERYLGQEVVLNSEHFRVVCHDREVDLIASGLPRLESLYQQFAAALGTDLSPGERMAVRILASTSHFTSSYPSDVKEVTIISPYSSAWGGDWDANYLANEASSELFIRLALRSIGLTNLPTSAGPRQMWWHYVLNAWQRSTSATEGTDWLAWLFATGPVASAVRSGELLPLSELGELTFASSYDYVDDWELINQEAWSVVYYVAETYGAQAFPALLRLLPEANSIEDWLQQALDVDPEAFEADWQAWLMQ